MSIESSPVTMEVQEIELGRKLKTMWISSRSKDMKGDGEAPCSEWNEN
jgi:hypothetical protein